MWLLFAFLSSALYAVAETFDEFFVNKKFAHPFALVFYASLFNLVYIPLVSVFQRPELPAANTVPIFILLGLVNVGYLYPYYRGLQIDDTSTAISFFGVGRIFVPIFAFLIVGEVLTLSQYFGILFIMVSTVVLGLHHANKSFKFSKAFWYISCAALLIALEGVLLKLLFDRGINVATAVGGEALISLFLGTSVVLFAKTRVDIKTYFPVFKKLLPLFLAEELFAFFALISEGFAISSAPVSVVKGITSSAPFFLLAYAWVGGRVFPDLFKEDLHKKAVLKKLLLFALLIVGIILLKE